MTQNVFTAKDVTESRIEECDVCIIGSGAGGGTLAANLTAAGKRVVMLEAGLIIREKNLRCMKPQLFKTFIRNGARAPLMIKP